MNLLTTLGFTQPLILLGLLSLPVIWWFIRALPPEPQKHIFPAIRFLGGLDIGTPPANQTPWWLIFVRLLMAAVIIVALSGPVWKPSPAFEGRNIPGEHLLVIDNGWTGAADWPQRLDSIQTMLGQDALSARSVRLVLTALMPDTPTAFMGQDSMTAREALSLLSNLQPAPVQPDHGETAKIIENFGSTAGNISFFSDGIEHTDTTALLNAIDDTAPSAIHLASATPRTLAFLPPRLNGTSIAVDVIRTSPDFTTSANVVVLGQNGEPLVREPLIFSEGTLTTTVRLNLTEAQRTQARMVTLDRERNAATSYLFDSRTSRPQIGVAIESNETAISPYQSPRFYIARALRPYAGIYEDTLQNLLNKNIDILVLQDVGRLPLQLENQVRAFIESGGVVIRFANERMADGTDGIVPTPLRLGDRATGGALTWDQPQKIASFAEESPFFGLAIPDDVSITRQILAAPAIDLTDKTWASLEDGTPLVTAERRGNGLLVMFHIMASPGWSNLPLSGLFVSMLQRILPYASASSTQVTNDLAERLPPLSIMNGQGQLQAPTAGTEALKKADIETIVVKPATPPGLYGTTERPIALNIMSDKGPVTNRFRLTPLPRNSQNIIIAEGSRPHIDLANWLFSVALFLFIIDVVATLVLRGLLNTKISGIVGKASLLVFMVCISFPFGTHAQTNIEAIRQPVIGFVPSGNPSIDLRVSNGLERLGDVLRLRTSVNLGNPQPVELDSEAIHLMPLLYIPVLADQEPLTEKERITLASFMRAGGIVLFDTGVSEEGSGFSASNSQMDMALRRFLADLDIPPLAPVTQNHVLSKSFYLLSSFEGRIPGRNIWVDAASTGNDPVVSNIIISAHDFASAWATVSSGRSGQSGLPGGFWQQEMAIRFGINLVMYALTGTYKNDQLHMPAIMERLGN